MSIEHKLNPFQHLEIWSANPSIPHLIEEPLQIQILKKWIQEIQNTPILAAIYITAQRKTLLGSIVPITNNNSLSAVEILLRGLNTLYLKEYIQKKELLEFLLPSCNDTISLASSIRDLLPKEYGMIYIDLLDDLLNEKSMRLEVFHRMCIFEGNRASNSHNFFINFEEGMKVAIRSVQRGKSVNTQLINNIALLMKSLQKWGDITVKNNPLKTLQSKILLSSNEVYLKGVLNKFKELQKTVKENPCLIKQDKSKERFMNIIDQIDTIIIQKKKSSHNRVDKDFNRVWQNRKMEILRSVLISGIRKNNVSAAMLRSAFLTRCVQDHITTSTSKFASGLEGTSRQYPIYKFKSIRFKKK